MTAPIRLPAGVRIFESSGLTGSTDTPQGRFEVVRPELTGMVMADPVLVESYSNDVWLLDLAGTGPAVLRVCWRGNRQRLLTESLLGGLLPAALGYPEVLASGQIESPELTWALTRRLNGTTVAEAWPVLSGPERRRACRDTAVMLRALHGWRPGPEVTSALLSQQHIDRTDPVQIVGTRINPLPLSDLTALATAAAGVPGVDQSLVAAVVAFLGRHRDLLPDFDEPSGAVLHADLHLGNIWWDGSAASALIDFEFARLGPAWADLARIRDSVDSDQAEGRHGRHELLWQSLAEDYPELFAVPQLGTRIRACRLAYELRQLILWPPPSDNSPADQPQAVLRGLLALT